MQLTAVTDGPLRFDCGLEAAVVAHWSDLMPNWAASGAMEIVYGTAADRTVDYLKLFSSGKRGYCNLVCEYWLKPLWSHSPGLNFVAGTHSVGFAATLTLLFEHEEAFVGLPLPDRSLQITWPTHTEQVYAKEFIANVSTRFAEMQNRPRAAAL